MHPRSTLLYRLCSPKRTPAGRSQSGECARPRGRQPAGVGMYLDFYQLKSAPFPLHPDPTFFFRSASHHATLDALAAGIATHQGLVTITGAKGVGKTTLVHTYLARLAPPQLTTIVLWQARLSFRELLALVARRFAGPGTTDDTEALLAQLLQGLRHEALQGRTVALIIDEAQDLPLETLEQLPLLASLSPSPESPLQLVLLGQPALLQHQRRRALRRVAPRRGLHATLRPLTEAESLAYIRQRVARVARPGGPIFTQGALTVLVRHAHGVPHELNRLCTTVLQAGCWAQQQPITADLVQQVLAVTRGAKPFPLGRLGLATAAGLGLVAGLLWVAPFSPGPQTTRRSAAARAHLQSEAPRPTSAPVLVAPHLPQPEPAAPAASPPSTAVGHDPGEDPVRLGPQEALEHQLLETPPVTLTSPASAVPPPAVTLPPRVTTPPPASPRGRALKSCNELKAEIQAKLDAKSVTGYGLTILASGDVQGHQIVGSCEGGTKKIALHRSRDAP
jgi:general secretion pathway protein A